MKVRLRRLRANGTIRAMVQENRIDLSELVYPVFVAEGENIKQPIETMPGIYQYSIDMLKEIMDELYNNQIRSVLLFGIPKHKDEVGSSAYDQHGVIQNAVSYIKNNYPDMIVIADVCLCEYTDHGHCGLVKNGKILNDQTLPLLARMAVSLAVAGADIIAPSDMMDGRIGYIREQLDQNGFTDVPIMAYSAKFASAYYSPFRDAAHSAPAFGDRKTYQMDPANGREAIREIEEDILEGADFVMVKPALAYLDVVKEASMRFNLPVVTYNVSGEYSMVKAAAGLGYIDEKRIVMENLLSMKRASAKIIITYHALDVARWMNSEKQNANNQI